MASANIGLDRARTRAVADSVEREAAFEAAFIEHYGLVYGLLFRLLGDRGTAEDIAVEAFWRLWRQAPGQADNQAGWLVRVALRLGYNALRASSRRRRYEMAAGREALDFNAPPDPAQAAERADEGRRVRAVLAVMRERDAGLLLMRHSGRSYKEIAEALQVAPGSVGTLLARAEAEFERRYLQGQTGGP